MEGVLFYLPFLFFFVGWGGGVISPSGLIWKEGKM